MSTQTLIIVGLIAAVGILLFVFGSSDTEVEPDFEEDEFGFEEEFWNRQAGSECFQDGPALDRDENLSVWAFRMCGDRIPSACVGTASRPAPFR